MKRNSILLCILFAIAANLFITAKAQVNTTDSLALVDLYNSTNGNNWYNHTNWLTTKPVSTWYAVAVTGNRVTSLSLQINGLNGTLPASIGNLTNLTYLNLQSNPISGIIPASIGNLHQLTFLNFGYDQFSGAIPVEIGNCTNLTSLTLYFNHLSGNIPAAIGNLTNLTNLELEANQLTGVIPVEIGNLVNLTFLNVNLNQLTGTIPSAIGNCVKLQTLSMFSNQLSGAIPATIGNCAALQYVQMFSNQLSGAIPASIGNCTNLIGLYLNNNAFSDSIPASIGNLTNLTNLSLNSNQLSGHIPATVGNLINLTILNLNNNQLSGAIPASLHKLNSTATVNLGYNRLTGFSNVHSSLDTNYIHGTIAHNLLTFNGLQAFIKFFPSIKYAPQDTILPIHQNGNSLSVSAGGVLKNNIYNWHRASTADSTVITKDSTFTPSQSGSYYVMVTNKAVKKLTLYSDTINYVIAAAKQSSNTFIAKAAQSASVIKQMQVFPNPAKDVIHIQINGTADIIFTNSAGKIFLSKNINNSGAINVSSYANGIYYIQNKTTGETQKIIVVH